MTKLISFKNEKFIRQNEAMINKLNETIKFVKDQKMLENDFKLAEFYRFTKKLELYRDLEKAAREYHTFWENHPLSELHTSQLGDNPLSEILDQLEMLD